MFIPVVVSSPIKNIKCPISTQPSKLSQYHAQSAAQGSLNIGQIELPFCFVLNLPNGISICCMLSPPHSFWGFDMFIPAYDPISHLSLTPGALVIRAKIERQLNAAFHAFVTVWHRYLVTSAPSIIGCASSLFCASYQACTVPSSMAEHNASYFSLSRNLVLSIP